MLKKWGIICLSAIMITAIFTGCSNSSNNTSSPPPSNTPESSGAVNNSAKNEPLGKYDPPISIGMIRQTSDSAEANLQKLNTGETTEDNRWTRMYEEKLGIKIKFDWIAKGEAFDQKRKLTLATGDIPEFMAVNASELKQLYEAGLIQDMTDVYKNYVSDFAKGIMELDGSNPFDAATFDGKMYAIPNIWSSYDSARFLWIRYDWLQNLGLPEPETMEDVLKISEAFATRDPDGNSKKDTFGLGANRSLEDEPGGLQPFFNAFGAYPEIWFEKQGELVYGTVQPEMKTALLKLQQMYKSGEIDKEFAVKDSAKVIEDVASGKIGMLFGGHWAPFYFQAAKDLDPALDLRPYAIPGMNGETGLVQLPMGTSSWWVARKDAKNPEAIMKLINMQLEISLGETADETFTRTAEGLDTWGMSPVYIQHPEINIMSWNAVKNYVDKDDLTGVDPISKQIVKYVKKYKEGDNKQWSMYTIYAPSKSSMEVLDFYIKNDRFQRNMFYAAPTPSMVKRNETLKKLREETFTKIIIGDSSIDEFDNYVEQWKTLGGNDIMKEVAEWRKSS